MLLLSSISLGMFLLLFGYVPGLILGRRKRAPEFKGPVLTGTAQVQYVRADVNSWSIPPVCWIALRVQVPGREPYDAQIKQQVPKEVYRVLRRGGGTVAVQVDSTNPLYVWVDFTQPMPSANGFATVRWVTAAATRTAVRVVIRLFDARRQKVCNGFVVAGGRRHYHRARHLGHPDRVLKPA
jgi:hypothetical protein